MSSPISRRTLAKGAAWAAPVVAATATVPAYAASTCEQTRVEVQNVFKSWKEVYVPNLSGSTLRLWWTAQGIHSNGTGPQSSTLRAQWSGNTSAELIDGARFGIEFAQRNVDTSVAVNNFLSGVTLPGNGAKMPVKWPADGVWNKDTGEAYGTSPAQQVDTPTGNQRDVSHASSFLNIYKNDGSYTNLGSGAGGSDGKVNLGAAEVGEETGTPEGNALTWLAAIAPERKHYFKTLTSGNIQDLLRNNWRGGAYNGGHIYTSVGFRVVGVLPPTLDDVIAQIGDEYVQDCLVTEYRTQYEQWINTCAGLGGLKVTYSHFSNGTVATSDKPCDDSFVWSHETGAFYTGTREGEGTFLNTVAKPYTNATEFFGSLAAINPAGWDTTLGRQLRLRDGIW